MCTSFEAKIARMVQRGQVAEAARKLSQKLYTDKKQCPGCQNLLAICKAKLGYLNEAKQLLEQIHNQNPKSPMVLNNLGNIALLENNAKKALAFFQEAVVINPWAYQPRFNAYLAYNELGQIEKSLWAFQQYTFVKRVARLGKTVLWGVLLTGVFSLIYIWFA